MVLWGSSGKMATVFRPKGFYQVAGGVRHFEAPMECPIDLPSFTTFNAKSISGHLGRQNFG